MKLTLLEIVQDILNDLDSDEVNSIDDTVEAQQIAQIVKSTYFALLSNRNWPHLKKGIKLEAYADLTKPTHMKLADNVKELSFVNYDKRKLNETRKRYEQIKWMEPDDFLAYTNKRNSDEPTVKVVVDFSGIDLLIRNDQQPTYYTSFDDSNMVFDSYDAQVDDTLVAAKFQAQGYVIPTWSPTDDFIPDLPDEAFTLLLEESKSRASFKLKQVQDVKAEQEAGRQNRWLSRKAWRVNGDQQYPDYGRLSRKGKRDSTFRSR